MFVGNSQVVHLEDNLAGVRNLAEAGFAIAAEPAFHQDIRWNNSGESLERFALEAAPIVHSEKQAENPIAEAPPVAVALATAGGEHSDTVAEEPGRERAAADSVARSTVNFLPTQIWAS